ncbi:MAG TPA: Gx transporter family protein [Firmicutes bacterium]|nr:Gx transporter family protein [Bacillota bacterium]
MSTKKLVELAMLTGMGIALHAVEGQIPVPLSLPGAKLGLANSVALATLREFSLKDAITVNLLRTILGGLISGSFLTFGFFLSFSGALASTLFMWLAMDPRLGLSCSGVSVVGAAIHNLAQLTTAMMITREPHIFVYLPYLLLYALPAGLFNGVLADKLGFAIRSIGRWDSNGEQDTERSNTPHGYLPSNSERPRSGKQ